jgi:NAD+ synthase (glutamine-hydrolysing)
VQTDEEDIGLSYKEIKLFNDLRNKELCGIVSTFLGYSELKPNMSPAEVQSKCEIFFKRYFQNRHKTTVLTPSVHLSGNSCDDNRYDLRPFLYDLRGKRGFDYQWERVESIVQKKLKKD